MTARLNLASRPFRNRRLPALLLGLAFAGTLGLTAGHAYVLWELLSARTTAVHDEVAALEQEARRLEEEHRQQRVQTPDKATLAQWTAIKDIVDQRTFSWVDFLSSLEAVQPRGVRFKSITPTAQRGQVRVALEGNARTTGDLRDLVRAMEASEEFRQVFPRSEGAEERPGEGLEISVQLIYQPRPRPVPSPSATAAPTATAREGSAEPSAPLAPTSPSSPPSDEASQ